MAIKNSDGSQYAPVFHPEPLLALAIVKAWDEDAYRGRLLSDEHEVPLTNAAAARGYRRVGAALRQVGLDIERPVVMTLGQYEYTNHPDNDDYMREEGEIVFVFPNKIAPGVYTLAAAQIAMAATPCGM